ncbi:type III-D CRISPR-associated protein Csx19 [Microtetraspora fusca]|uniref:type III-D CRISPR-associated protein Csx19 n=1 Tax=Microtetraspora fusca TaxID=1997 RepID=UPI00083369E6|nr:CRISPR-associated protein Csx19 [Microtetraspora fusca]
MTTLYGAAATGVTLPEALEAARLDGGCALLTTPSAYRIARVEAGGCVGVSGRMDMSAAYEARVFTSTAELRWVESGYAVLLTEDERLLPKSFGERVEPLAAVATLDSRYLVWGAVTSAEAGWTSLTSSRVGSLAVPLAHAGEEDRVRLAAREYVVADREHGNAYVAEERLIGFEPYAVEGAA